MNVVSHDNKSVKFYSFFCDLAPVGVPLTRPKKSLQVYDKSCNTFTGYIRRAGIHKKRRYFR
jgi:hypothetical protein